MNRLLALIFGIAGGVIGFVINIINSATRFVGQIVGITDSGGHVIIGTLVAIVACIAAILAMGFFFAIGWWALIPAVFLLVGAWFAMRGRAERRQPAVS
jgi:hypothetical protein